MLPIPAPELPSHYPDQAVAEHEVLLSFNGDHHALFFRLWWDKYGEKAFLKWANAQKSSDVD